MSSDSAWEYRRGESLMNYFILFSTRAEYSLATYSRRLVLRPRDKYGPISINVHLIAVKKD